MEDTIFKSTLSNTYPIEKAVSIIQDQFAPSWKISDGLFKIWEQIFNYDDNEYSARISYKDKERHIYMYDNENEWCYIVQ